VSPDLTRRLEHAPELLDEPAHAPGELEQSLAQVAEVNRMLGGTRAVLRALRPFAAPGSELRVLDIGTGSADIPVAIARWASRRKAAVRIVATDVHPQMRRIAAAVTAPFARVISVEDADALALPYADDDFDVAILSLTLHHFDGDDPITVLREAARVARRAVIINELERCRANWYGARLLARTRWRGNRLTRHDGPLSVRRAFTPDELHALARRAGLRVTSLDRRFFYRLVLVADTRAQ
jgi:SAM-dependent methyltransferase